MTCYEANPVKVLVVHPTGCSGKFMASHLRSTCAFHVQSLTAHAQSHESMTRSRTTQTLKPTQMPLWSFLDNTNPSQHRGDIRIQR